MAVMTGLSGNEIYCLHLKGMKPGDLVVGNSVFSMGFVGSLAATGRNILGGAVFQHTRIIQKDASKRSSEWSPRPPMAAESESPASLTNSSSFYNTEFLSLASCVHNEDGKPESIRFTSSANGQELYCQMEAGLWPVQFVFGNVAYSIGAAGGIIGSLRVWHVARSRSSATSSTGIATLPSSGSSPIAQRRGQLRRRHRTRIMDFQGVHEMLMLGTASNPAALPPLAQQHPFSSDLTNEEMWNLVDMGYLPIKLLLGTAVYSLGVVGGLKAAPQELHPRGDQRPDHIDLRRPRTRHWSGEGRSQRDRRRRCGRREDPYQGTWQPAGVHGYRNRDQEISRSDDGESGAAAAGDYEG